MVHGIRSKHHPHPANTPSRTISTIPREPSSLRRFRLSRLSPLSRSVLTPTTPTILFFRPSFIHIQGLGCCSHRFSVSPEGQSVCPPERPFHIEYETPPLIPGPGSALYFPLGDEDRHSGSASGTFWTHLIFHFLLWIPLREPGVDEVPKIPQMPRPSRPCGPVGAAWDAGTLDGSPGWPFDLDSSTP